MWARHNAEWRDPAQIASQWEEAANVDRRLLRYTIRGAWWETLAATGATLLVTREYEHLIMALRLMDDTPTISYMKLPHPSGLAIDVARGKVYVAATRNPNQIFDLAPVTGYIPRLDVQAENPPDVARPLLPVRSRYYPGCFYMHDLALIGGVLHANSVGQNAVVRLDDDGGHERVWWPKCIEKGGVPVFGQNHIQLNSIAAGNDLEGTFFSASTDRLSARRPGHKHYPVDRRGVIFSGRTRAPVVRGLTRPHSARFHDGQVWVDNSGYGEVGVAAHGCFTPVARLPGWTRGLAFHGSIAFVGTSRVLARFQNYAPGLEVNKSLCAIHAISTVSGKILGSLIWPYGNQIFAIELAPLRMTSGFPFRVGARHAPERAKKLFYTFSLDQTSSRHHNGK